MASLYNPQMVWVMNQHKEFDLLDRFDGQPYKFPAGKRVRCHRVAANHFFACDAAFALKEAELHPEHGDVLKKAREWWELERTRVMTRQRWNLDENGQRRKDGDHMLKNFVIEPIAESTAQVSDSSAA